MFASASHEFRTPLNAILAGSHQIARSLNLNEAEKTSIKMIISSSNLLLSLVDDILDLAKHENQTLSIHNKEFMLLDLMNEVRETFEL